jgi:hypothetical protein
MVLEELSPEGILKRELGTADHISPQRRFHVGSTLMSHNEMLVLTVAQMVGFGPGKSKTLYLSTWID